MKRPFLAMALVGALSIGGIFSVSSAGSPAESSTGSSAEAEAEAKTLSIQFTPDNISDKGNVKLPVRRKEMEDAGYSFGDMLNVTIDGQTIDMPFGSSYSDVDSGCPVLICRDDEEDVVRLTVNMGNFAAQYLHGVRNEEKGEWVFPKETAWPLTASISMKEKGGYYDEYLLHRLSYTNAREDYPNLTDEEFGNFREVTTTGMGSGILYRCSSPISPEIGRSAYVDQALQNAGVTVVMNLTDNAQKAESYEGFKDSYYATTDYIPLSCGMDFTTDSFRSKLKEGLEFFAGHPGVYAVHCLEGKDRTGVVSALLECLMGADLQEVVDDYMITFYNYYGVTRDDERYETIADSNIRKTLKNLFGVSDLESQDLQKCAGEYLAGIGMSSEDVEALEKNLSADAEALRLAA